MTERRHSAADETAPAATASAGPPGKSRLWKPALRIGVLIVAVAVISLLHMTTAPAYAGRHAVYEYLYYLPIIAAAAWYGAAGGILTALVVSMAYVPLIETTWSKNAPYEASQFGQVLAYNFVGGSVGYLLQRQRRLAERYRSTAAALEIRNRELQTSHDQLRQAERLSALGEIAAGLAHELRNPITAISAAMDILGRSVKEGTTEAEFADVARKELTRLGALLDEFLSFARPRPPQLRPTPVRPLLDHVAVLLQKAARERDVTLVVDPAADGHVTSDAGQITQVLLNVVLNGIQATPAGGTVTMSSEASPDLVSLFVDDDGAGVARNTGSTSSIHSSPRSRAGRDSDCPWPSGSCRRMAERWPWNRAAPREPGS